MLFSFLISSHFTVFLFHEKLYFHNSLWQIERLHVSDAFSLILVSPSFYFPFVIKITKVFSVFILYVSCCTNKFRSKRDFYMIKGFEKAFQTHKCLHVAEQLYHDVHIYFPFLANFNSRTQINFYLARQ